MTKLERKAIARLVGKMRTYAVRGSEVGAELGRVELASPKEARRLLESADFQRGWDECHLRFTEYLKEISACTPAQLRRYVRNNLPPGLAD